jgi:hypothetical protein
MFIPSLSECGYPVAFLWHHEAKRIGFDGGVLKMYRDSDSDRAIVRIQARTSEYENLPRD